MLNIGVIGYGYWGPNILRNFSNIEGVSVVAVCDRNHDALKNVLGKGSGLTTFADAEEMLKSTRIDAVAIVTPVSTHYELARKALENGKHVFVEKPFTASS